MFPKGKAVSHAIGQKGRNIVTFLHSHYLIFVEGQSGTFGLLSCVNYNQDVHNRITVSCDTAWGWGSEKWHGCDLKAAQGHLFVQLSFLTIRQELPSCSPSRRGLMHGSEHRKWGGGKGAEESEVRYIPDKWGVRLGRWTNTPCFQDHSHWCTLLCVSKLKHPCSGPRQQSALMTDSAKETSVSSGLGWLGQ